MALSCGGSMLKFFVFFFNAIVFIGGGVITCFGIYLVIEAQKSIGIVPIEIPVFILTIGLLVFVLGFLGCTGACCENKFMLKTFAILITILVVCEFIGGILMFVFRHKFVEIVGKILQEQIKSIETSSIKPNKDIRKAIEKLQKELKCCGGFNSSDWQTIPSSCCANMIPNCLQPFDVGCAQAMYDGIQVQATAVGVTIIIICLLQIGAIVCSFCLTKKISQYESV